MPWRAPYAEVDDETIGEGVYGLRSRMGFITVTIICIGVTEDGYQKGQKMILNCSNIEFVHECEQGTRISYKAAHIDGFIYVREAFSDIQSLLCMSR